MCQNLIDEITQELLESEMKLLSIIIKFIKTNRKASTSNIEFLIDIKIPSIMNCWKTSAEELISKGVITYQIESGEKAFDLTEKGTIYSNFIYQNDYLTRYFYDEFYKKAEDSLAHKEFCENVYNKDLCQHGMTDMKQLDLLIHHLNTNDKSDVLEIGCGNGYITEYISDVTRAHVTGIDISPVSIESAINRTKAKSNRLNFETKNIYDLDYKEHTFDAIIAIDSLFFINPFGDVVEKLIYMLKPGASMYAFFIYPPNVGCLRFDEELDRLKLNYSVIDLTKENYEHWVLKEEVLLKLKSKFEKENNMFLYNNRIQECQGDIRNFKRFLYIVNK
ncbi:class I SAM-dependent methyltransferase [Brassicibacter mesophilus]|uniref:class I SAM-dependent methyltransferase n=1 Tax=Brassicibacter mesophilus TaxID=745119 RepID=UPI003D1E0E6E